MNKRTTFLALVSFFALPVLCLGRMGMWCVRMHVYCVIFTFTSFTFS